MDANSAVLLSFSHRDTVTGSMQHLKGTLAVNACCGWLSTPVCACRMHDKPHHGHRHAIKAHTHTHTHTHTHEYYGLYSKNVNGIVEYITHMCVHSPLWMLDQLTSLPLSTAAFCLQCSYVEIAAGQVSSLAAKGRRVVSWTLWFYFVLFVQTSVQLLVFGKTET